MRDQDSRRDSASSHSAPSDHEDATIERTVLLLVLAEHPRRLTLADVLAEVGGAEPSAPQRAQIERAVCELATVGLLSPDRRYVSPSAAALRCEQLKLA